MLQILDAWFQKMEEFLHELKMLDMPDLSKHLWNADETGFCTAVASQRVLAKRGALINGCN